MRRNRSPMIERIERSASDESILSIALEVGALAALILLLLLLP